MRKYIIFANLFLVIVVIFFGMKSYDSAKELSQRKKGNIRIKDRNREFLNARKYSRTSFMEGPSHPANYYNVITKKNLFRPEREEYKEPVPTKPLPAKTEKKEPQAEKKSIPPPAIDLYGIMIDKQKKVALLYDKREKKKNLRYKVVSTGATIQGYKITSIKTDQIILERDGSIIMIQLNQAKEARGGIMAIEKKAPTIIKKTEIKGNGAETTESINKPLPAEKATPTSEFNVNKQDDTKPVSSKKRFPFGAPTIVQEGDVKYRVLKTPVGEKKIRIN